MRQKKTKTGVGITQTYGIKVPTSQVCWIVVGDLSKGLVFESKGRNFPLQMVREFPYPVGRRKGSDLYTDRPGRSFDSWTSSGGGHQTGGARHAMSSPTPLADQAISVLSKRMATWLETSRKQRKFDSLILVAGPRLLGGLKAHFSQPTARLIHQTFEKDYAWLKKPELERRLSRLLPVEPSSPRRGRGEPWGNATSIKSRPTLRAARSRAS